VGYRNFKAWNSAYSTIGALTTTVVDQRSYRLFRRQETQQHNFKRNQLSAPKDHAVNTHIVTVKANEWMKALFVRKKRVKIGVTRSDNSWAQHDMTFDWVVGSSLDLGSL
jgi:hypothetical protein